MGAFKDKKGGTWYVQFRYTDWQGKRQQKFKRGFATKREAQDWERQFLLQTAADVNMTLESFYQLYERDVKPKIKLTTWITKESLIQTKILPYFRNKRLCEITPLDVVNWQNELRKHRNENGKPYSQTYLRSIHNQFSSMFNHARKYYGLHINPAYMAGSMGGKEQNEMKFWTKEEYLRFAEVMMDKPMSYYAFEVLYWTGIREGELLALTPDDFDFDKKTLRISKSYQRLYGEDVITSPKTVKSNRVIPIPDFLADEVSDYISRLYGAEHDSRIFPVTKSYLYHEMERGCKASGVKRIRIHDLRHSHVSLLYDLGFTPAAIADRMGHETIDITLRYTHLFQSRRSEMAERLNIERGLTHVS